MPLCQPAPAVPRTLSWRRGCPCGPGCAINADMGVVTRRIVRADLSLALVAAWSLISLGAASHFGTYTPRAVALVTAGMVILTLGVLRLGRTGSRPPNRASLVVAGVVGAASAQIYPAGEHARGPAESWAHGLLVLAAAGLIVLVFQHSRPVWLANGVIVLAGAAGVAGIIASPNPPIDVWAILQGSAHALVHGHNIYAHAWSGAQGHTLPYLPGTAILVAPFYLAFGDVRYGLLAALVVAALAVAALKKSAGGDAVVVLSCLIVLFPRYLYGIEQSWPEPLLLALIAGMVWAVESRRLTLAVVCLTGALITKQHALMLLPLAAIWPAFGWRRTLTALAAGAMIVAGWFVAGPRAFVHGAITYNLNLRPRLDSLSLFTTSIRAGLTPSFVLVPLLMLVVLAVGLWKLPRTTPGFVLGSAWLLGMFNLLNKQTFFNEWSFVVGLIMLGVATTAYTGDREANPTIGAG
jgi:hypothetical protein